MDESSQLLIQQNVDKVDDLSHADFCLKNYGLHLYYTFSLDDEGITFNGFTTTVSGNFNIENNQVIDSKIVGNIKIPVIDKIDPFEF